MSYIGQRNANDGSMMGPPATKHGSRSLITRGMPKGDHLTKSLKSSDTDIARFMNRDNYMKEDHYEMNIVVHNGRIRKFIFDHQDTIFKLTEATLDKAHSNNCVVCEKDIQKKDKRHCDFCGSRACEKCMHKKRQFMSHISES